MFWLHDGYAMKISISDILGAVTHRNRKELYSAGLACLVVLASLGVYKYFPAQAWLLLFLSVPTYAGWIFLTAEKKTRYSLAALSGVAFLLAIAVAYLCGLNNPELNPHSLDDATYLHQARAIAREWKSGHFPVLSAKGSALYYVGSLHTGYQRLLAGIFSVWEADYRLGIWLNFISVALIPTFTYWAVYLLLCRHSSLETAARGGIRGACLAAFYPSLGYWASWLLKDVVLATIFTASLAAALDCFVRKSFLAPFFLIAGLYALILFRAYAAWALVAGVIVYGLSIMPRRQVLASLIILMIAAVLASYTESGGFYFRQLGHSLGELLPSYVRTLPQSLAYFLGSIPRLMLSPYAWVKARVDQPMYEVYPGMWWLYGLVYPLAFAGLWQLGRWDVRAAIIPFVAWAASAAILIIAYGGNAPRQRLYLDTIFIVLAGCGTVASHRRLFFGLWFAFLALYITIHLTTLDLRLGPDGR